MWQRFRHQCLPILWRQRSQIYNTPCRPSAKGVSIDTTRVAVVHLEAVVSTLLKVSVKGSGGIVPAITLIDPDEVVEAMGSGDAKGKFKGVFTLAKTGNYTLEIDRDPSSTSSSGAVKYKVSGKAPKSKQLVPEP